MTRADEPQQVDGLLPSDAPYRHLSVSGPADAEGFEQRHRTIADALPDMVWSSLPDGTLEYVNERTVEYLGRTREEVLASTGDDAVHPDDRADFAAAWQECLRTGESFRCEIRLRRRDGIYRWHLARALPGRSPEGQILRFIGTSTDIEDQKRVEEGERFLAKASAVLSSSLETATTLASVAKLAVPFLADWCVVDIVGDDRQTRRLAVAHRDPTKVEMAWEMYRRYPDDPRSTEGVPIVLRTGEPLLVTSVSDDSLAGTARDEEHLQFLRDLGLKSYIIVPLKARGRMLGAMMFVTSDSGRLYDSAHLALTQDLAHRASLAVDNARLYQEAENAIQTRDNFVAVVSHELRNLLGVIVLKTTLLKRTTAIEPGPARDHADAIQRSVERMNRLIHDLLDLASIEAGQFQLDREPQDVAAVIGDAFEQLQPLAVQKHLLFEKKVAPEIASGEVGSVFADRERIVQVFSNLVGNAVKFTPAGGRITLEAAPGKGEIRFTVSDTGPGIPPEQTAHIFDRFWRVKQPHRQGTGLGLSIAKGIIDAHEGRLWVETRVGEGSRFHFTLPLHEVASVSAPPE